MPVAQEVSVTLYLEAVISIGSPRRCCLALLFLLWITPLQGFTSQPQPQSAKKPAGSPAQQVPQESQTSPYQELQKRVQAQHDAIQAGNPVTVETTSRALVAFALRGMAQIRALEAAWPQGIELYRQSLALEDDNATRLALAGVCISADRYDEGLVEVNKVLAAEPKNAEAWHTKGKILMAKEDYKGAAEATARSLELRRDANAQLLLALAYLNLKEKPKAEAIFKQMTQDYGDRAIWHVIIGGAYRETGYQFEAVEEFRRAIAMDNTVPHVHYFLGLTLMEINNNGTTPEIMKEYQEEVRQFPDDFFGNYGLGGLESRDGDLEHSNQHLLAASKADPNNPDPYMYLGLNAMKQRDNATAEAYLRKAVLLTGDNVSRNDYNIRRGYIGLARILASEGKKDEAQVYFDKAKALSDSEHRANEAAFSSYLTSKEDTGPAVVMSKPPPKPKVPTTNPADVDFTADIRVEQLGNTRLTPAQLEEAEKRVRALRSILGTGYDDWGTSEAKQGQFAMALSHFQDAEKWDDSTPGVMRNIGLAALKLGNNDEAARAFRVAVEKNPSDTSARAALAISLFSSHQYAEAAKAFSEVGDGVYRDPRMAYAWAFSLARINDPQKATEVLNKLTSQSLPKEMWMTAGDVYTQVDDYKDALRCFEQAIELDPTMDRAHHFAGVALIRLGRPSEAIPQFEAELKLSPDDPDTQYNLAYALLETSQKDQAMAILQKLIAAHPDHAQAQYEFGKELLNSGDKNEAIVHLEAAARLDPNVDYIHYQLQAAYRKAGRTSDADRELQLYKEIKAQQREKGTPQPQPKQQNN